MIDVWWSMFGVRCSLLNVVVGSGGVDVVVGGGGRRRGRRCCWTLFAAFSWGTVGRRGWRFLRLFRLLLMS